MEQSLPFAADAAAARSGCSQGAAAAIAGVRRSVSRSIQLACSIRSLGLTAAWLGLAAAGHAQEVGVLGLPRQAVAGAGKLMICGGGPMPDAVFNEFVKLSHGATARIVVIPTARLFESRADMEGRFAQWRKLPVASLSFLDTQSRDEANQDDFVKPLDEATGVWISGGSQGRLADIYGGTKVEQAILSVLARGGVVGGTSAGAAIMSHMMIRYGSPKAEIGSGFNLLARAVIDQHFIRRNRQERLLGVLAAHPDMLGLGIDEGTALVVEGDHLRVLGQSQVIVCKRTEGVTQPWIESLKAGEEVDLVGATTADAGHGVPLLQHRSSSLVPAIAIPVLPAASTIRTAGEQESPASSIPSDATVSPTTGAEDAAAREPAPAVPATDAAAPSASDSPQAGL